MRGLNLSDALGCGFSCKWEYCRFSCRKPCSPKFLWISQKENPRDTISTATRASHLFILHFFIGFHNPGLRFQCTHKSIYFSSHNAVLPTAYPYLLFKGITTYGWPTGYWFFHGIIDKLKHFAGFKSSQAMVLNAMGYDEGDGKIMFEKSTNKICFSPPRDPLLPRKVEAFQKLTKKLGGILFLSRYRSTSVHLLGGCNASSDPSQGVCNSVGQVFDPKAAAGVHPGLYVCDGSLIPCSVGVNPCLTIAAVAEHVSRHLVKDVIEYKNKKGIEDVAKTVDKNLKSNQRSMVVIKETMKGYIGGMPCTAYLKMKMNSQNLQGFDYTNSVMEDSHSLLRGKVGGCVVFTAIDKDTLHVIDGDVDLCQVDSRTPYTQYMRYRILLAASSGLRYILEGKKIMNPFLFALYAWRETTTLHVTFKNVSGNGLRDEVTNLTGELKISVIELLKSLMTLEGNRRINFACLLTQSVLRTYILQIPRGGHNDCNMPDSYHKHYPSSSVHEIKAEDGRIICCRQWKCGQTPRRLKGEKQLNPVLLLNGYSIESSWLPTEPNDLVRTLLEEGHETWLLQSRLHPLNPADNFTIEDIGRYDIPAAIGKILELHGHNIKVHIVAHCAGGLAIHIALMGGHISATHIASLSCTNSSMFFKLNALATFKMWLPLVPVSMAILGKNNILPLLETSETSFRHHLLRCIARFIPRYERCTCNECEVLSGVFGNVFWHQNISRTMHHWIYRENTTRLPMAGFPHLRKICNSGFIVDSHGNNSYLIHPERMKLSTLYISGGRSLLVTPETSFLGNKYMKMHQPGFRHERVVVDGFGHSDLLIGEEADKKVFPHILSHIRLAEQGKNGVISSGEKYSKESLAWEDDFYSASRGFGSSWYSQRIVVLLMLLWVVIMLISLFL
ncbi:hypothetical protein CICLE_v10011029mg [Citrus x clementina]|uniref:Cholesterol oxidase n=2 Tax=Citrus clementina TaxID=85681 RepID=V4T1L1_CITCL|nr:hypothetical protein CICLE_v10011029mg [Citrus x clementina]